jgi:hypothetical protein
MVYIFLKQIVICNKGVFRKPTDALDEMLCHIVDRWGDFRTNYSENKKSPFSGGLEGN